MKRMHLNVAHFVNSTPLNFNGFKWYVPRILLFYFPCILGKLLEAQKVFYILWQHLLK